jgi:hypothetical protein
MTEPSGPHGATRDVRACAAALVVFVALTAAITFPQISHFSTSVPYHSDPYFSMWRLGWVAHAIAHSPQTLFEANIFYPEHHALAYSDAMLLPGTMLAPLFWAGLNPVVIYNFALFAAFALSGTTAFILARQLTDDTAAALAAGVIYAFAPYRFTHYMHLELQIVFWIPLALLMIHRIISRGGTRDGVLFGVAVACQVLSCIYSGIFLVLYCGMFVPLLFVTTGARRAGRVIVALIAAAVVTVAVVSPYALAYLRAEAAVGTRDIETVRLYSASLTNYLSAPAMSRLYGWKAITNPMLADEMNLFPGIVAVVLAAVGLVASRSRVRFAYVAGLIFSFMMTLGINGFVYRWLFEYVPLFRGLRSPARFDILVNLSLAILSAYGVAFLLRGMKHLGRRRLAGAGIAALLLVEYASAPAVLPAPKPSKVDVWLAQQPPAVIVELPLISAKGMWGSLDWLYMYQGIAHFQRMLNGYSGYAPASFYEMRQIMASFPDDRSMAFLRHRGVDYVVVRAGIYEPQQAASLLEQIQRRNDLSLQAMWTAGPQDAEAIYAVRK